MTARYRVQCPRCGIERIITANIRFRLCRSCTNKTHGMRHHPAYKAWDCMITRCYRPAAKDWVNYGGRGIAVCERWKGGFSTFWEDMKDGYKPGLQIERIDNDGNYTPENCTWATRKEQGRNKRDTRYIDTPWGRMTLVEASERSGLSHQTIHYRLQQTSDLALVFSTPDRTISLAQRGEK